MTPQRYRPLVEVDAVQVTEENASDVAAWCGGGRLTFSTAVVVPAVDPVAKVGDWVVKGTTGKFFWVAAADFATAYEVLP